MRPGSPGHAREGAGSGDVEIEIRIGKIEQVLHALEGVILLAELERDVALGAGVDLRRRDAVDESDGLGDARLEFGYGLLVVFVLGHLDAAQARHRAFRQVAGHLHLARQREHVGIQPERGQRGGIQIFCIDMGLRLVEQRGKIVEHVNEARRAGGIHGDGHGGFPG